MESNKLGKKIQDWAANLGFTLPDGTAPPADHFASLIATPHRRQLWEALVEAIQSRQKVEHMRKQILVAELKERKKYSGNRSMKQITDRFDLWHKQNAFEADVKEQRSAVVKLERNIMTKASDSLFEICKLSELKKLFEEHGEKSVLLKLLIKRNKKLIEDFDRRLLKVKTDSGDNLDRSGIKENLDHIENNSEECCHSDSHNCELSCKIEAMCKSGLSEECLWEEVVECKRNLLDKFSRFLADINSNEKTVLGEKEREIKKKLITEITQLKQKTTEKSLEVIINSTKGKQLDGEIERLEESLFNELNRAPPQDHSLNKSSSSFFLSGDLSKPGEDVEKTVKSIKNYLNVLELQKYQDFLKEEMKRVEEEMTKSRRQDEWKDAKDGEEGVQLTLKAFDSVLEEINSLKLEEEGLEKEIFRHHSKVETLLLSLKEEMEGKGKTKETVEEAAEKVKLVLEKQMELLLETPLDVFRTVETSSGRVVFECESASQCLNNYGGELKQFFSAMLIPPVGDTQGILSTVEKRRKVLGEIKRIMSEREELRTVQRKTQHQLSSIQQDTRLCEKNFSESDAVLWNVLCKTDRLFREVDHVDKILNHWVEQPYRSMIKETSWGKSLKETEEKYTKGKNE